MKGGGGGSGMLPRKKGMKWMSWCILSVPKYVIIHLKINYLKNDKSTTTKTIPHISNNINADVRVSTKVNTFTFYMGSGWLAPKKPKKF